MKHSVFVDCVFESSLVHTQITGPVTYSQICRCLFDIAATKHALANIAGGLHVDGCIFNGGAIGIQSGGDEFSDSIINCTFYLQTTAAIKYFKGIVSASNNIFFLAAADDYAIQKGGAVGQTILISNNCAYSAAGALTNPYYDSNQTRVLQYDESNIFVDPLFVDAVGGDFRLLPQSPCLNVVQVGAQSDNFGSIGAWQRKSFLGY